MAGWHVTANDIKVWTNTNKRRSEELLPLLVQKLILASCNPTECDFPHGDDVSTHGWDGIVNVEGGDEFVPSGLSGWECGTSVSVNNKADSDYDGRVANPEPFTPNQVTFVFVTTRVWEKRKSWEVNKEQENIWKNVKGINASLIADWLGKHPSVHRWFAEKIGKRLPDNQDLEQAWDEFSSITNKKLTKGFFIFDRQSESESLLDLVSVGSKHIVVKSTSKNEAYGFILVSLISNPALSSRCLIIDNQQAWDLVSRNNDNLILIAKNFQPQGISTAIGKGHTVVNAVDITYSQEASITILKQPRTVREKAIQEIGFNEDEAYNIYKDTNGYFEPILRHATLEPVDYVQPNWVSETTPEILFAVFFATEWSGKNENDRKIIEQLSNLEYSQFESEVIKLSKVADPPIRVVGDVWQVVSKIDFWLHIKPLISKIYLERLHSGFIEVLSEKDPSFELAGDEKFMASIKGMTPKFSSHLRAGLSDSVALVSVYGDECSDALGGLIPSVVISGWIRELFSMQNDLHYWYSLNPNLSSIGEAAPEEFLNAVENSSAGDNPVIKGLFQDDGDVVFGRCNHASLLWSLEAISWDKRYLSRVSSCLARLAEIDPGGTWGNRPSSSLVNIFLGWKNNTSATRAEHIEIIKNVLVRNHSDQAWKLMVSLLLNNTRTSSGISNPKYREWTSLFNPANSRKEYYQYVSQIVDILIEEVEKDIPNRIVDLIDNFASYNDSQKETILTRLKNVDTTSVVNKERIRILSKIREILSHHREFLETSWSWPSDLLNELENLYNNFDFDDIVESSAYLFNTSWPHLVNPGTNHHERSDLIDKLRIEVLEKIYQELGIDGIARLVDKCNYPRIVGFSIYKSKLVNDVLEYVLNNIGSNDSLNDFCSGYVCSLSIDNLSKALELYRESTDWKQEKKANYLLELPLSNELLKLCEELEGRGKEIFWTNWDYYKFRRENKEYVNVIGKNLLKYNRPISAIVVISEAIRFENLSDEIDCELVGSILLTIAKSPSDIDEVPAHKARHEILETIEFIQNAGSLDEEQYFQIEWAYLEIFRFESLTPKFLFNKVARDPKFFSQLVAWVFKSDDGHSEDAEGLDSERLKRRAEIAFELLDTISLIPGTMDGVVDPEKLLSWVSTAREMLKKSKRERIGDSRIGEYLSRCPVGSDGIWPHESVRDVIETVGSEKLMDAVVRGRENSRGTTSRSPFEGGTLERDLVEKYNKDAEEIQNSYPKTAGILRSIAKFYIVDAKEEDSRVELRE